MEIDYIKYKKCLLVICLFICLFSIASVCAGDVNDAAVVTSDNLIENNPISSSQDIVLTDTSSGTFMELANEIADANGEFNLTRNYVYVKNDSSYKGGIIIDKSISINGNGFTINGNKQASIFNIASSNVVLNNINFVNGYANQGTVLWSGDNGILFNCSFENCSAISGGSVFWSGDNGNLFNCSFVNSNSINDGGSIYWTATNGSISDCIFENSKVYNQDEYELGYATGGSIYWSGDGASLFNCYFVKSYSLNDGGAVNMRSRNGILFNCSFVNCSSEESGGAVYVWAVSTLNSCSFVNCSAGFSYSNHQGGAVYQGSCVNCIFINNVAEKSGMYHGQGGAMYGGSALNCIFINNSAYEGGAMYGNSALNCIFINNSAYEGGAMYVTKGDVVNSTFINNTAMDKGGGIYFDLANCSLVYPYFEGNVTQNGSDWYCSYPINLVTKQTVITAPNVETDYGVSKDLIITLKDVDNEILVGQEIAILLDNEYYYETTNSNGQALFALPTNLIPNSYVAVISYAGNSMYNSSNTTASIVVNKVDTTLIVPNVVAIYNTPVSVVATLKDVYGNPVSSVNVKVTVGSLAKTLKTDANGQVSLDISSLDPGNYKVSVKTATTDFYNRANPVTSNAIISDGKINTTLTVPDVTAIDNDSAKVVATFSDVYGNPVSGVNVKITVGSLAKTIKTDANGQAVLDISSLESGMYDVTVITALLPFIIALVLLLPLL